MKKRLFAMFLVLVMMTVAVAACGKSGNKESSKNKNDKYDTKASRKMPEPEIDDYEYYVRDFEADGRKCLD